MSPNIIDQEIPSFDPNKQFVVAQGPKISEEQRKARLQMFWYREELLRRIKANWYCRATRRSGELNLRPSLRLNSVQLEILKKEDVEFLIDLKGEHVKKLSQRRFSCVCNEYVTMTVTLRNRFSKCLYCFIIVILLNINFVAFPVKLILRVQPVQSYNDGVKEYDLSNKLLMEGVQQVVLPEVC